MEEWGREEAEFALIPVFARSKKDSTEKTSLLCRLKIEWFIKSAPDRGNTKMKNGCSVQGQITVNRKF